MITLSHIDIRFDKTIVENGTISIPDRSLTVITGKSGSGKTSLLYLVGLISSNSEYDYLFDGLSVNLGSDVEVSQIRKTRIGYVFQDNSLIESLSIGDNVKYSAKIAGLALTDGDVANCLEQVSLDVDIAKYPRVLSGGERQRLALACARAKKPDLIIADEPTSALDNDNSVLIMTILQELAVKHNKKIVIASHNPLVRKYADVVYEIKDEKIILVTGEIAKTAAGTKVAPAHQVFGMGNSLGYAFRTMKRTKFQKIFMVILCAIAISLATGIIGLGEGLVEHQTALLENISDREIFLVNFTAPLQTIIDVDEHFSMSSEDVEKTSAISSVDSYYPYFEFRSTGYDVVNKVPYSSCTVKLLSHTEERTYDFNEADEHGYNKVVVVPYYEEEMIRNRVCQTFASDADEPIYLSHELANLLGLTGASHTDVRLSLRLGIPVFTTEVELNMAEGGSSYGADVDLSVITQLDIDVSGVLDHSYVNTRSGSGNAVIYMPVELMLKHMDQAKKNVAGGQLDKGITAKEWLPSSYVVFVKSYNDISTTIGKLESINPNFKAVSGYQDIESMNLMASGVRGTASWIIVAVLFIVAVLMTIIYINDMIRRKYEFAVIKANGLSNKETLRIAASEALIQFTAMVILAVLLTSLINTIVNGLFSFDVLAFTLRSLLVIVAISLLAVLAPTVGSIIVMNRVKPDCVLRN